MTEGRNTGMVFQLPVGAVILLSNIPVFHCSNLFRHLPPETRKLEFGNGLTYLSLPHAPSFIFR
jgi:hypothetical protein